MKIQEKEFNVYKGERPKVLLLGNGICRAYNGVSWNGLLDEIKDKDRFPHEAYRYVMPMPLKAAMLTGNCLGARMRDLVKENREGDSGYGWNSFVSTTPEMQDSIKRLADLGFDYILTTNYSYEIEASLLPEGSITRTRILSLMDYCEVDNAQTHFLINTFNTVDGLPVWHVHGEARKPDSMIIGSFYYGKLLRRCIARLEGASEAKTAGKAAEFKKNIKDGNAQKIGSWIDAFVLGDVYILGLGLDLSEADLWWLIEYKSNNADLCGKTVFYDPAKDQNGLCLVDDHLKCEKTSEYICSRSCQDLLLDVHSVDKKDLGVTIKGHDDYKVFYEKAIADLKDSI